MLQILLDCWDFDGQEFHALPGQDVWEWIRLCECDYDWIDRFYLEHDTAGGE